MATGQTENFPVHSKYHRPACSAQNGHKKAANLFQDLLLHVLPLGGGLFNFGIVREFQSELKQAVDQCLDNIILHISVDVHLLWKGSGYIRRSAATRRLLRQDRPHGLSQWFHRGEVYSRGYTCISS